MKKAVLLITLALLLLLSAYWLFGQPRFDQNVSLSDSADSIERGRYLVVAGGCLSCHKGDGAEDVMSGGLGLETDFGTFYAPNITPDLATGIGSWQAADFIAALKYGRSPGGAFYYPAFPYRAYANLSDQEILDIASYLMAQPAVSNTVPDHDTPIWLNRWMMAGWNRLADLLQTKPEVETDPIVARGAHLARSLGHCGECHTPRNSLGIPYSGREFSGAQVGEDTIEAIDSAALAQWTAEDFDLFLFIGLKPDGEFAGGDMGDVIEHNTSKLTDQDRAALAAFFTR